MNHTRVMINDQNYFCSSIESLSFEGKHSMSTLAGLNVTFVLQNQDEVQKLDLILSKGTAEVGDPVQSRTYSAGIKQKSYSYTDSEYPRYSALEIREIDDPPFVDSMEINGDIYPVVKYKQTDAGSDIVMNSLLKLNIDQFKKLQEMISKNPKSFQVRRIGVDENALEKRTGGMQYWSQHEDESGTFIKLIIRLLPVDYDPKSKLDLGTRIKQNNTAILSIFTRAKLEALLNVLTENGVLSSAQAKELLEENPFEGLSEGRRDELYFDLDRVVDSEEHL